MKQGLCFLLLVLLGPGRVFSQTPHLKGTIEVSITTGTLKADLELSQLPPLADYRLWLNTGLGLKYVADGQGRLLEFERRYAPDTTEEAWQYVFTGPAAGQPLPPTLRLSYTGAFPVYPDTLTAYEANDWKGNIAFNGRSVRATEQSAWYPILYDRAQDRPVSSYTYELSVRCADCQTAYLNGAAPAAPGQLLRAASPVPLLLFAGNYTVQQTGPTYFLNSQLSPAQAAVFGDWVGRTRRFYEQQLRLPYGADVVFLATTPISRGNAWMFVTYPTIASVGHQLDFSSLFRGPVLADSTLLPFFAHEIAHYYFGTRLQPNATLRWALLEGCTEYLALKSIRATLGPRYYRRALAAYADKVRAHAPFPALAAVRQANELDNTFRYAYFPLQLLALERQWGEKRTYRWLSSLLRSPAPRTDYAYFRQSLLAAGLKPQELAAFEQTYLRGAASTPVLLELTK